MNFKVGTLTIKSPHRQNIPQEVAAWHTEVEYPAGRHDVFINIIDGKGYLYTKAMETTIVANYTPSLFGGVSSGKNDGSEEVGKTMNRGIAVYTSMLNPEHNIHLELDKIAKEWIFPAYEREWLFDENHSEYARYLTFEKMEMIKQNAIKSPFMYQKEYVSKHGFDHIDVLHDAVLANLNEVTYSYVIAIDNVMRQYTSKGIQDIGVSPSEAYKFIKNKQGEMDKAVLLATKELMNAYDLKITTKENNDFKL